MVSRLKLWATFISWVMPMPPCSWMASWPTWRQASDTLIFAADTTRRRSAASISPRAAASTRAAASRQIERDCSALIRMSTIRCCSTWKVPMGTPNCLRVFRYSSVVSFANLIAPTASQQASTVAKSTASSMAGKAWPASPSSASAGSFTPAKLTSAARRLSMVR